MTNKTIYVAPYKVPLYRERCKEQTSRYKKYHVSVGGINVEPSQKKKSFITTRVLQSNIMNLVSSILLS